MPSLAVRIARFVLRARARYHGAILHRAARRCDSGSTLFGGLPARPAAAQCQYVATIVGFRRDGVFYLTDLGSKNGTWVNDVPVHANVVRPISGAVSVRLGEDTLLDLEIGV